MGIRRKKDVKTSGESVIVDKIQFEDGSSIPSVINNPVLNQGTLNDPNNSIRITPVRPLTMQECHALHYGNQGTLKLYILRTVDDCFRKGYKIKVGRRKERELRDILTDREIQMFKQACEDSLWSGAGYIILIDDEEDLSLPLSENANLVNAFGLSQLHVKVYNIETNIFLPNVNKPANFSVESGAMLSSIHRGVDHTRILPFVGYSYDYEMMKRTRCLGQGVYSLTYLAFSKWEGSVSLAVKLLGDLSIKILKVNGLAAKKVGSEKSALNTRLSKTAANLTNGMAVVDTNEQVEIKGPVITGTKDLLEHVKDNLCASLGGAPRILLFGEAPSGISTTGESGWNNHYNSVKSRQETQIIPNLRRYIAIKLGIPEASISITANSLKEMTEKDEAIIDLQKAQAESIRHKINSENKAEIKPFVENTGLNLDDTVPAFSDSEESTYYFLNVDENTDNIIKEVRKKVLDIFNIEFKPKMKHHITLINGQLTSNDVKALDIICDSLSASYRDIYLTNLEMFYNPTTKQHCLVYRIGSFTADEYHEALKSAVLEGKVSNREYKPHITIGYADNVPQDLIPRILNMRSDAWYSNATNLEREGKYGGKIWL